MARIKFTKKDVNQAFSSAIGGGTAGAKPTGITGKLRELVGIRKTELPPTPPLR